MVIIKAMVVILCGRNICLFNWLVCFLILVVFTASQPAAPLGTIKALLDLTRFFVLW